MKTVLAALALAGIVGCGADGPLVGHWLIAPGETDPDFDEITFDDDGAFHTTARDGLERAGSYTVASDRVTLAFEGRASLEVGWVRRGAQLVLNAFRADGPPRDFAATWRANVVQNGTLFELTFVATTDHAARFTRTWPDNQEILDGAWVRLEGGLRFDSFLAPELNQHFQILDSDTIGFLLYDLQ